MTRHPRPYSSWELRGLLNRLHHDLGIKTEGQRATFIAKVLSVYFELLREKGLPPNELSTEIEAFAGDLRSYLRRNPLPDPDAERKAEIERRKRLGRLRLWVGIGAAIVVLFGAFAVPALQRFHQQTVGGASQNFVTNEEDAILRRELKSNGAIIPAFSLAKLKFGLLFGLGSKDVVPAQVGWCPPEQSGVWSCGREARLAFRITDLPRDFRPSDYNLRIEGSFFRPSLYSILGRKAVSSDLQIRNLNFMAPLLFFMDGDLVFIKMVFPDARSPMSVGLNNVDDRLLGLSIASLSIEAARR